jgi:hypothetical protein
LKFFSKLEEYPQFAEINCTEFTMDIKRDKLRFQGIPQEGRQTRRHFSFKLDKFLK